MIENVRRHETDYRREKEDLSKEKGNKRKSAEWKTQKDLDYSLDNPFKKVDESGLINRDDITTRKKSKDIIPKKINGLKSAK